MNKLVCRKQRGIAVYCGILLSGWFPIDSYAAELNIKEATFRTSKNAHDVTFWSSDWLDSHKRTLLLTAGTLEGHLTTIGNNCLRELGRLILAQDRPLEHNVPENNHFSYMNNHWVQKDLCDTTTLKTLIDHILSSGHLDYHPYQKMIRPFAPSIKIPPTSPSNLKGIFNIASPVKNSVIKDSSLYTVATTEQDCKIAQLSVETVLTPRDSACNLIKAIFSSHCFNDIQILDTKSDSRFTLDATYAGDNIVGINYQQGHRPKRKTLGSQSNGTYTDRVRVVVEVSYGTIYIISLYPRG